MALQCCVTLLVENNMNMNEVIVEAEINETGEPSDITDIGTETVGEGNFNVNPWPRLEELFTFSSLWSDKENLLFKCKLCKNQKSHFRLTKRRIRTFDKNEQQMFFNLSSHFVTEIG
jgi:hypothetical protein